VYVKFDIHLKTPNEDVVEYEEGGSYKTGKLWRTDCSRASLSYHFYATLQPEDGIERKLPGPDVILVARIKTNPHHFKAGNINNCLYNENMQGSFAVFLDNDMKPKNDFLLRCLPWFFYYNEQEGDYKDNESICFVQTPQFFKEETIDYNDFLGGRNSVFFQGIQTGRDGYDLTSFAGTNAVFRLKSLYAVGGMPYGSVTEDSALAIEQHKYGYRSIYVSDKLCVGLAPVTPANSMQQRSRWVKGSVQMFMNAVNPFYKYHRYQDAYINHPKFSGDPKDRVESMGVPASYVPTRNFFRRMYMADTILYPFSAVTAINYMIVAILFIVSGVVSC
jgi:cellulose synthase (UDP-forming)